MNNRLYGNLIFELSKPGRRGYSLPKNEFGHHEVPAEMRAPSLLVNSSLTKFLK